MQKNFRKPFSSKSVSEITFSMCSRATKSIFPSPCVRSGLGGSKKVRPRISLQHVAFPYVERVLAITFRVFFFRCSCCRQHASAVELQRACSALSKTTGDRQQIAFSCVARFKPQGQAKTTLILGHSTRLDSRRSEADLMGSKCARSAKIVPLRK